MSEFASVADAKAHLSELVSRVGSQHERVTVTVHGRLSEQLPEFIAFAAPEFITGPLLENPHRVGKQLRPPLEDRHSARRGTYRVIYRIDDTRNQVTVVGVLPRSEAYRGD
jgi:mRNA interferase RelE/StbE